MRRGVMWSCGRPSARRRNGSKNGSIKQAVNFYDCAMMPLPSSRPAGSLPFGSPAIAAVDVHHGEIQPVSMFRLDAAPTSSMVHTLYNIPIVDNFLTR